MVIPCAQPHSAVAYAVTTLPAGAWTSDLDKLTIAYQQCQPLARNYFNGVVLNPDLKLGVFAPLKADGARLSQRPVHRVRPRQIIRWRYPPDR